MEQEKWSKYTTPYAKDYSIEGTNLSTFISIFKKQEHKTPKVTLQYCDDCQIYISKLNEKILECRVNYDTKGEQEYKKYIEILQQ